MAQNQRLAEQLKEAIRQEQALSAQLCALRESTKMKRETAAEHARQVEALKEEVNLLSDQKGELEKRFHHIEDEKEVLESNLEELTDAVAHLQEQNRVKDQTILQQEARLQEACESNSRLQERLDGMILRLSNSSFENSPSLYSEIRSVSGSRPMTSRPRDLKLSSKANSQSSRLSRPEFRPTDSSVMCSTDMEEGIECDGEDEFTMGMAEFSPPINCHGILQFRDDVQENYELKEEMSAAYKHVRNLCEYLKQSRHQCSDSGIGEGSNSDDSEADIRARKLQGVLHELETLIHDTFSDHIKHKKEEKEIEDGTPEHEARCISLRSQIKHMHGEITDLRKELKEMKMKNEIQEKDLQRKNDELMRLTDRLSEQQQNISRLQLEKDRLMDDALRDQGELTRDEVLQQTRCDRDTVLEKYNELEKDQVKLRLDMVKLDGQLLEAIQQKVALSREIEDWETDMQEVLDTQIRTRMNESGEEDMMTSEATTPSTPRGIFKIFRRT